jgi:hypothetical protein
MSSAAAVCEPTDILKMSLYFYNTNRNLFFRVYVLCQSRRRADTAKGRQFVPSARLYL